MLIISRKRGEEIVLDERIRVKVVSVAGNRVKLAFDVNRALLRFFVA